MTVETIESLRREVEFLQERVNALVGDRAALVAACEDVYARLVEPNPTNGDPAPWDVVDDEHPVRVAARRIIDTLVSLGIEA